MANQTPSQKKEIQRERKESLKPGQYGVPEAPPPAQARDPEAGLEVTGSPKKPRRKSKRH